MSSDIKGRSEADTPDPNHSDKPDAPTELDSRSWK